MKVRPFEDRVIIKQDIADKEQGGVLIPDASQVAPARGLVVAVGPGIIRGENMQLKLIFNLLKWFIQWFVIWRDKSTVDMPDFSSDYNPMQVRVGDRVMFGKYAGTKITIKGEEFMMVRQSDVFMADDDENP